MRPVTRPPLREQATPVPRGGELLAALGAYCSLCERPIPAEFWVMDGGTGRVYDPMQAEGWDRLLLLCHDCTAAHRAAGCAVEGLFLPDADTAGEWPFTHAMEAVTVTLLDDAGEPARTRPGERVIVRGATPEARATIHHFALNTAYYHESDAAFRVPRWAQSTLLDRRADHRTDAWLATERLVELLEKARYARALVALGRGSLASQGFWYTAATVLRARLADRSRVAALLSSPPGALPVFPGTRAGWP